MYSNTQFKLVAHMHELVCINTFLLSIKWRFTGKSYILLCIISQESCTRAWPRTNIPFYMYSHDPAIYAQSTLQHSTYVYKLEFSSHIAAITWFNCHEQFEHGEITLWRLYSIIQRFYGDYVKRIQKVSSSSTAWKVRKWPSKEEKTTKISKEKWSVHTTLNGVLNETRGSSNHHNNSVISPPQFHLSHHLVWYSHSIFTVYTLYYVPFSKSNALGTFGCNTESAISFH